MNILAQKQMTDRQVQMKNIANHIHKNSQTNKHDEPTEKDLISQSTTWPDGGRMTSIDSVPVLEIIE